VTDRTQDIQDDPATVSDAARAMARLSWDMTPDRSARNAPACAAWAARFERQVDPEGVLPPNERAERAESARRAFYREMALRSAEVRRAKAAAKRAASTCEDEQL